MATPLFLEKPPPFLAKIFRPPHIFINVEKVEPPLLWSMWDVRTMLLPVGGFLTLCCDTDTTYKQSLCSNDFFCSLPSELVFIISGRYTWCNFYHIFFAAMICFQKFQKFCPCVDDKFLFPKKYHDNWWRVSKK